jgi:Protein of unknown function (DUF1364)
MSAITESARGEICQIRYARVCNHNRETTVWAHANGSAAGKGVWIKSPDILGAYACSACHDLYDARRHKDDDGNEVSRDEAELGFWEGHARSLVKLEEKGFVVVRQGANI